MSEKPYNIETVLIVDKNKTSQKSITNKLYNRFKEEDRWLKKSST